MPDAKSGRVHILRQHAVPSGVAAEDTGNHLLLSVTGRSLRCRSGSEISRTRLYERQGAERWSGGLEGCWIRDELIIACSNSRPSSSWQALSLLRRVQRAGRGYMKQRSVRVLQLTIAALCILIPLVTVAFGQTSDNELNQDIAKLDSFLSSRNLDSIQITVDKESAKWRERDRPSFIIYMTKACSLLSSYDIGDLSKRASLLSRYGISVLTSGTLPLEDHVQFVSFLMFDPLVIDEAAWKTLRQQKAELWLAARRRVQTSVDPAFDFNEPIFLNVAPPAGSGLPAGIAPESVRDPKLRAEYERAIAENSAKTRRFNDQYWLKKNAPDFYQNVERYLVNAYSRPPRDYDELERLLVRYVDDNGVRARILQDVRTSESH